MIGKQISITHLNGTINFNGFIHEMNKRMINNLGIASNLVTRMPIRLTSLGGISTLNIILMVYKKKNNAIHRRRPS